MLICRGIKLFRWKDLSSLTEGQFKATLNAEQAQLQTNANLPCIAVEKLPRTKRHRAESNASGRPFPGSRDPYLKAWCHNFLDEQIQLMRPKMVVALGAPAREDFGWHEGLVGVTERAGVTFKGAALYHPAVLYYLRKIREDTGEVGWDWQIRILKEVVSR